MRWVSRWALHEDLLKLRATRLSIRDEGKSVNENESMVDHRILR
jgi:hypothetical protein